MTPLTMDDFANIYDAHNKGGRRARTLPMDQVFKWVESSPYVDYNAEKDEFYRRVK